jgi:hypothetical protein
METAGGNNPALEVSVFRALGLGSNPDIKAIGAIHVPVHSKGIVCMQHSS